MLCTDATGTHEAKKAVWKSGRVDVEAIRNEDLGVEANNAHVDRYSHGSPFPAQWLEVV